MGHGICLYRTTKHHKEGWAFCGSKEREDLPNFYINNTDLLLKFIVYFKSMAEDIIDVSDERKLIDITFSEQTAYPKADFHEISTAFKKALEKSRYCLESPKGQFWLTAREIDCLRLKNQGLSAKMIARELDISHRTVESFLDNVKSKSPLSSLNETIKICRQQGLL
ncbi:MAG TPA: hypothetical protein DD412_03685 [Holosporales bacterium]|nr:hypothetical protein [Holosporales bacterium]